jgi:lipoate-protein ligase A
MELLQLHEMPIIEQLQLEEALLRTTKQSWCILNTGAPPAIVMGISGNPEELINCEQAAAQDLPLIKRFSGGGTVYIDPHTIFITFICDHTFAPIPPQSQPILEWALALYEPLFPSLELRENDYTLGTKKIGGNALYIQRTRWLIHTSFLWDYSPADMSCLLLPKKRPDYRQDRPHTDFLTTLRPIYPHKEELLKRIREHLSTSLSLRDASLVDATLHLRTPHRQATTLFPYSISA